MDLLPRSSGEFASASYWERFFKKRGQKAFEWYGEYTDLCGTLHKYIKPSDTVLHIGCGNSSLGSDLYDVGYKHVTNIDISNTVVKNMTSQHQKTRPDLKFMQMDMCEMSFEDCSFKAVLDKGTLDAVFTDNEAGTLDTVHRMFAEIERVLRVGGRYVCISLAQDHILKKVTEYFPQRGWMTRICYIAQPDKGADQEFQMPVFAFVFTKFKPMPNMKPIMEIAAFEDHAERVSSAEKLVEAVKQLQNYGLIKQQLNKRTENTTEHVSLEMHSANNPKPRYTLFIVNSKSPKKQKFAIFVVPIGRESDWLFCESRGRDALCEQVGYQRLLVVFLSRAHTYESMDQVKAELSSKVMELAPEKVITQQVPIMSLGESIHMCNIEHEATSSHYGPYTVEQVNIESQVYRRLIYNNQPLIVQDQVLLVKEKLSKSAKKRGVAPKLVADDKLTLPHHMTMLAGLSLVENIQSALESTLKILVIGLKGGVFPTYIARHCPKAQVSVIEKDAGMVEIASAWFDLANQKERLDVKVGNAEQCINQLSERGDKMHAIVMDTNDDVTSAESLYATPSPPKKEFLQQVDKILEPSGVLMINFCSKDASALTQYVQTLETTFSQVFTKELSSPGKQVIFALQSSRKPDSEEILCDSKLSDGLVSQLAALQSHVCSSNDSDIDLVDAMEDLCLNKS